jgi:N-methylhydantoinase B
MIAQSASMPFHLGAMPDAIATLLRRHGRDLAPGDIFIMNDPFDGAMHLPDIFMMKPVFFEDSLLGFSIVVVHHTDIGGRVPGGNASDGIEIFQEGLRIPLLRWVDRGTRNDSLEQIIRHNVRVADIVMADILAQEAAVLAGERELTAMAAEYGPEGLMNGFSELLDYTERMTRSGIAKLPHGEWEFTDYIDSFGPRTEPVVFHAKLSITGDSVLVDLTGSSPQVRAGINCSYSFTKSCIYLVLRSVLGSILGGEIPNNAGFFRPVTVVAPPGTDVNHVFPAPCAERGVTGFRLVDTLLGAFAQALPRRLPAAGDGGNTFVSVGGYRENGDSYVWVEPIVGAWGGRPTADGLDGNAPLAANIRNSPVEVVERTYPVRVNEYGFITNTGGPGKYRGGLAIAREWQLLDGWAILQVRSDRRDHLPWGVGGGKPGTPSSNTLNPGGSAAEELPTMFLRELHAGDTYRHVIPSGGGFGNPFDRDPSFVLKDVREEKITPDFAREQYGVVVKTRGRSASIDEEATQRLRSAAREQKVPAGGTSR